MDGEAHVIGYEGSEVEPTLPGKAFDCPVTTIASGAFAGTDVEIVTIQANTTQIEDGAFTDCASLKGISFKGEHQPLRCKDSFRGCGNFVAAHVESPDCWAGSFPQTAMLIYPGMEINMPDLGEVTDFLVPDDGCLYGILDNGVVLLNVPVGTTKLTFEEVRSAELVYIADTAFDNAELTYLSLPDNCVFDFSLFDIVATVDQIFYSDASMVSAWIASCLVATAVNEDHGAGTMLPDYPLTEIAMLRAEELPQSFDYNRPDGSSWGDLLNDNGIDWYSGFHWVQESESNEDALFKSIEEVMTDLSENPYDDDGNIYTELGCGIIAEGDSYYYAWFFTNH